MYFDAFELLYRDLSMDPEDFFKEVRQDPAGIVEQIRTQSMVDAPLILAEDLKIQGNQAVFITKGNDLRPHLEAVFNRISDNADFVCPPLILPSAEINRYLKEKISSAFAGITRKIMDHKQLGRVYDAYEKDLDLKGIATYFTELINQHLFSPAIITGFLAAFTADGPMSIIEENTKAAFVAMAALKQHEAFIHEEKEVRKNRLIEMGMAVLFQDVACIVKGMDHDESSGGHADASALLAKEMNLSDRCVETIRWHHRSTDANGAPIMMTQTPPLFEQMAVATNAFIRCISTRQFGLSMDQAVYVLSHYAQQQYYDAACVRILSKISLGECKQNIITKSFEFSQACPNGEQPLLWDVRAKLPNRFICTRGDCPHLSDEEVVLYEPIKFNHPGFDLNIPAGHYYKCTELTRRFNRWMLEQKIFSFID